jgi:hypothetical protein
VGSRNKQRPTFEKRQREIARQERQAEKRARRRARAEGLEEESPYGEAGATDEFGMPIPHDADTPSDDADAPADETITPGIS